MESKKQRGFTLVELLAILVLLALIATIAGVSVGAIREKVNERQYRSLATTIEVAAEQYASEKGVKRLYVCFPQNCTVGTIDKYEIVKETKQEDILEVKINNGDTYLMTKVDDIWKFDYPILVCK